MSSILKKLLILLVIACFASKESISSESIKSFFSNSTLNIESSSLEIIDSEKKAADAVARDSVIRQSIENSLKKLGVTALWWQPYGLSLIHI